MGSNNLFATLINRMKNALVQVKGVWFTKQASHPQTADGRAVLWADSNAVLKYTSASASTKAVVLESTTVLASLTEASGAIGGTNDGNIPDLTATAAALTGSLTGTANGAMVDVAATAGSCAGGSSPTATNVDSAIATAVASIVSGVNEQNKEMQAQINALVADNIAIRAAARELAAKLNAHIALTRAAGLGVAA